MKKLIVLVALVVLLYGSTGCSQSCAEQTVEYRAAVDDLIERWDDANAVAGSTARVSLSGPIAQMQELRREADTLEEPECAVAAQNRLVSYMDRTIDTYLVFMANSETDEQMQDRYTAVSNSLDNFGEEYRKLTAEESD